MTKKINLPTLLEPGRISYSFDFGYVPSNQSDREQMEQKMLAVQDVRSVEIKHVCWVEMEYEGHEATAAAVNAILARYAEYAQRS